MKSRDDLLKKASGSLTWAEEVQVVSITLAEMALDSIVSELQELLENTPKEDVFIELADIIDRWENKNDRITRKIYKL